MTRQQLQDKYSTLVTQARAILDTASSEKRELTSEEATKWDAMMTDVDKYKAQLSRMDRLEAEERELDRPTGRRTETLTATTAEDHIRTWLQCGSPYAPTSAQLAAADAAGINPNSRILKLELRAQGVGTPSAGGYLVPEGYSNALEKARKAFGGMRQASSVFRTATGNDLPWPTTDDTNNVGALIGENIADSEQDIVYGSQTYKAYVISSRLVRVSNELLQDSAFNLAEEIGFTLGERIARKENQLFTYGSGTGPAGVVPNAVLGKTGTTGQTTTITFDDFVDLQHSVDPAYRASPSCVWMFNDSSLAKIKKLKDGDLRPLWLPGFDVREPDTILGHRYVVNQDVPVMAANARSVLFGDFSRYKIRDVAEIELHRLDERYAEFRQVAFVAFARVDGQLLAPSFGPIKYYANSAS